MPNYTPNEIEDIKMCSWCKHYSNYNETGYCNLHGLVKQSYDGCDKQDSIWKENKEE